MSEIPTSNVTANYVVIEDEVDVRELLIEMITRYCPKLRLIGQADSLSASKELLSNIQPDIVFADINLGDGYIFSLFDNIQSFSYQIIFTTAYDQYALAAFELNAVHYLLKPFGPKKLINAVNRTEKKVSTSEELLSIIKESGLLADLSHSIGISTSNGIEMIEISKIVRVKADGSYSEVFYTSGKKIVITESIGEIERRLDSAIFIRVHASYLVNKNHIVRYHKADGGFLELADGSTTPVSRRKRKFLLDRLKY